MGPLERSLAGKGPSGKGLSEKQLKEIQELDSMIGEMGNIGKGMDK
jgi:hypothetical protein